MLASLSEEIEATPSESIRDLIRKEHRRQREELCHEQALREEEEERFGPLLRRLQGKEAQDGLPVAFLIRSILWMMESSALLRAGLDADDDVEAFARIEARMVERILRLLDEFFASSLSAERQFIQPIDTLSALERSYGVWKTLSDLGQRTQSGE